MKRFSKLAALLIGAAMIFASAGCADSSNSDSSDGSDGSDGSDVLPSTLTVRNDSGKM